MPREIERKFLVRGDGWRQAAGDGIDMVQGYLGESAECSVRVRLAGASAELNLKSRGAGRSRLEFEYPVPAGDARHMLEVLCGGRIVEKRRHHVLHAGHLWEVDEFAGANAGLVVAEIELDDEEAGFPRPDWLGEEVTDDARYYNLALAEQPWGEWERD